MTQRRHSLSAGPYRAKTGRSLRIKTGGPACANRKSMGYFGVQVWCEFNSTKSSRNNNNHNTNNNSHNLNDDNNNNHNNNNNNNNNSNNTDGGGSESRSTTNTNSNDNMNKALRQRRRQFQQHKHQRHSTDQPKRPDDDNRTATDENKKYNNAITTTTMNEQQPQQPGHTTAIHLAMVALTIQQYIAKQHHDQQTPAPPTTSQRHIYHFPARTRNIYMPGHNCRSCATGAQQMMRRVQLRAHANPDSTRYHRTYRYICGSQKVCLCDAHSRVLTRLSLLFSRGYWEQRHPTTSIPYAGICFVPQSCCSALACHGCCCCCCCCCSQIDSCPKY